MNNKKTLPFGSLITLSLVGCGQLDRARESAATVDVVQEQLIEK